jgi:hypothetical protein
VLQIESRHLQEASGCHIPAKNVATNKKRCDQKRSGRALVVTSRCHCDIRHVIDGNPMISRADSGGASPEYHVRDHSPSSSAVQRFIPGRSLVNRLRCQDTTTVVAMSRFLNFRSNSSRVAKNSRRPHRGKGYGPAVANRQHPGLCICAIPERSSEQREPAWVQAYCECRTPGRDRRSLA